MHKNLIPLFRQASMPTQFLAPMLRGAKKKKGPDGPAEAESNDIINILKDKTDPEIKPIDEYPVWLVELLDFKKNTDTTLHGMMHGLHHDHPEQYDFRTLMNHMRRRRIIDMNRYNAFKTADYEKKDPFDWNIESIIKADDEEAAQQEEEEEEDDDDE